MSNKIIDKREDILSYDYATTVEKATTEIMDACCKYKNFVISSGCDIPPATPWKNIDAFFDAVGKFYSK